MCVFPFEIKMRCPVFQSYVSSQLWWVCPPHSSPSVPSHHHSPEEEWGALGSRDKFWGAERSPGEDGWALGIWGKPWGDEGSFGEPCKDLWRPGEPKGDEGSTQEPWGAEARPREKTWASSTTVTFIIRWFWICFFSQMGTVKWAKSWDWIFCS